MDKIEMIKRASLMVVGMGVNNVVQNISDDAAPENSSKLNKAITWIGGAAISYIIVSKVCDYIEPKIEEAVKYINEQIIKVKEEIKK